MARTRRPLVMYGEPSDAEVLEWTWVDHQLRGAGSYWTTAWAGDRPHPRAVWGVWDGAHLHLSIGSPMVRRGLSADPGVTVHLGSDVDVVVVDGIVTGETGDPGLLDAYNVKYDWDYTTQEYGPLTTIEPTKVMAWRSAGWAGRGGFQATGKWIIEDG